MADKAIQKVQTEQSQDQAEQSQELTPWDKAKQKYPEFSGKYWTYQDIAEHTSLKRETVKDRIRNDPEFPKPLVYSKTRRVWRALDIIAFMESLDSAQAGA